MFVSLRPHVPVPEARERVREAGVRHSASYSYIGTRQDGDNSGLEWLFVLMSWRDGGRGISGSSSSS